MLGTSTVTGSGTGLGRRLQWLIGPSDYPDRGVAIDQAIDLSRGAVPVQPLVSLKGASSRGWSLGSTREWDHKRINV